MNEATAQILRQMNNEFYRLNAQSFASTRNNSWRGWELCFDALDALDAEGELVKALDGAAYSNALDALDAEDALGFLGASGVPESPDALDAPDASDALSVSDVARPADRLSVLDVACGNMRFPRWLQQRYPDLELRYLGVDSCAGLAAELPFRQLDVLDLLLDEVYGHAPSVEARASDAEAIELREAEADVLSRQGDVADGPSRLGDGAETRGQRGGGWLCLEPGSWHVVTCFGFMHHVPGRAARQRLLEHLVNLAAPGGFVLVSFWRFRNSDQLASRADAATALGLERLSSSGVELSLDGGDCLLGWDGSDETLRYCHHFSAGEVRQLAEAVSSQAKVVASFSCDGRTGNLNEYLVLRRIT